MSGGFNNVSYTLGFPLSLLVLVTRTLSIFVYHMLREKLRVLYDQNKRLYDTEDCMPI